MATMIEVARRAGVSIATVSGVLSGARKVNPDTRERVLKAVAEPTRLRLLALLSRGELNVKDLTRILNQSQPRISRHLKLLAEAGLIERAPEGSWVYFRLADTGPGREVAAPAGDLRHELRQERGVREPDGDPLAGELGPDVDRGERGDGDERQEPHRFEQADQHFSLVGRRR